MKCSGCIYCYESDSNEFKRLGYCNLTYAVVNTDNEHDCSCYNIDLSKYDICYNCRYYGGGGDWGLFCSHKDMYHHLGKFNDEPCKYYEKKEFNTIEQDM